MIDESEDEAREGVHWVIGDDRTYATRGEALAAAWRMTPPGGKRPEPRMVSRPSPDRVRGGIFTPKGGEAEISVKIPTTEPLDLRIDGAYVRKTAAAALNKEAKNRGLQIVPESTVISLGPEHILAHAKAVPIIAAEVPPPPFDPAKMAVMDADTKRHDAMYRMLKKALKAGAVTAEELTAAMDREKSSGE